MEKRQMAVTIPFDNEVRTVGSRHSGCYSVLLHGFPQREIEDKWRAFLEYTDCPSAYDTPEFFLEPYWQGKGPFAVVAFQGSEVFGVLTGLHNKERVISGLRSRPQVCVSRHYCETALTVLLEGFLQEAGSAGLIEVFSWHRMPLTAFIEHNFRTKQLEGDVVLDLQLGAEALFGQFHENRKRNIRAALKNGIQVSEVATQEDLAAYWEVYCGWQQTQRKEIHEHNTFENVQKVHQLTSNHRRFLARYQGEAVAATGVRFCPGGLVEYSGNCSLDEFNHLRPNDLLIWRTIEWACEHKFRRYSLGAAHPFLRKSGGVVEPIDYYWLDRTFLHRHELREDIYSMSRQAFRALPNQLQQVVAAAWAKRRAA